MKKINNDSNNRKRVVLIDGGGRYVLRTPDVALHKWGTEPEWLRFLTIKQAIKEGMLKGELNGPTQFGMPAYTAQDLYNNLFQDS